MICLACHAPMRQAYRVHGCDVLRCSACGLGRTVAPPDFDPRHYYDASYFNGHRSDGYADYAGSALALRTEFRRTLDHVLRHAPRRGRLLEFGCAYGFFLNQAAAHFERVHGIELAADAAAQCRSRGLDVTEGIVEPATLHGPYDAVVGLDVIEHLPDPGVTIRDIAAQMSPGAVLVLTTGDWGSAVARLMGTRWRLMTPPQHLSFFTERAMTALLSRAGLTVVEISHPWKHVPLSLIAYQLQRVAGLTPTRIAVPGALPINLWDAMRVTARK